MFGYVMPYNITVKVIWWVKGFRFIFNARPMSFIHQRMFTYTNFNDIPRYYEYHLANGLSQRVSLKNHLYTDRCHFMIIISRRNQTETFSALLVLCTGNSPIAGEFPAQRPLTRNLDVFFDLRLKKWLSKQSRRRWLETPSRSLWRHCNESAILGLH